MKLRMWLRPVATVAQHDCTCTNSSTRKSEVRVRLIHCLIQRWGMPDTLRGDLLLLLCVLRCRAACADLLWRPRPLRECTLAGWPAG
jgi:hypothetical protein